MAGEPQQSQRQTESKEAIMASFNIQNFLSQVTRRGLMRNNKFEIEIPIPSSLRGSQYASEISDTANNLKFWCDSGSLPGVELAAHEVRRYGYGPLERMPFAAAFSGSGMPMKVIADGNMSNWFFFQQWMNTIVNFDGREGMNRQTGRIGPNPMTNAPEKFMHAYEISYKRDYVVDVNVNLYDDTGFRAMQITLRNAYPAFLQDIPLNWEDRNSIANFGVVFNFIDWYTTEYRAFSTPNTAGTV